MLQPWRCKAQPLVPNNASHAQQHAQMESDAKIEQFVLLAGSTRGLALVELIKRATSEPGLFAFGELIDLPAIQEV